jgi:Na+(H+)/acetate symporter ActP
MGSFIAAGIVILILKLMGGAISISWNLIVGCFIFEPLFFIWVLLFNKAVGAFLDWMDADLQKINTKEESKEEEVYAEFQELAA